MRVPHYHESWDETVYGLGGTSTWRIAGRDVDLAPGESIFIPRGVVHGFENRSGAEARCLCILTAAYSSRLFPGDGCADLKGIAGPGSHARGHDPPWADPRASALGENPPQMWMARFSTAIAASFTASDSVGWAWQVRARSSDEPPNSIGTAASAIRSPASAPMMWTPSTRSVLGVGEHLHEAVGVCASPCAAVGREGELADVCRRRPAAFSSSSVLPTRGDSGMV